MDEKLLKMQRELDELAEKFKEQGVALTDAETRAKTAEAASKASLVKLSEADTKTHQDAIGAFIVSQKDAGRITPAMEPVVQAFMEQLPHGTDAKVIKFGEPGKEQDLSALDLFKELVGGKHPVVTFGELADGPDIDGVVKMSDAQKEINKALGVSDADFEKYGPKDDD